MPPRKKQPAIRSRSKLGQNKSPPKKRLRSKGDISKRERSIEKHPKYKKLETKYAREKHKKNLAYALIVLVASTVFFFSFIAMKDATIYFHSDITDLSNYERVELIAIHNGAERTYGVNDNKAKLPKSAELKEIRIYDNLTYDLSEFNVSYLVEEDIAFQTNQTVENIEFEEGFNFKNESSQWTSGWNTLHKQKILDFSFNRSYQEIKNMSISFQFKTNVSLNDFDVEFYNFQRDIFNVDIWDEGDLISGELIITDFDIEFPCVYLNRSSMETTNFRVLFHASETLWGSEIDFDFNITNVNISGYFWKEFSTIFNSETVEINIENNINIINTVEIQESMIIVSNIINITQIYKFGSFIETVINTFNNSVILEEKKHVFPLEDIDLTKESFFGLLEVDIYLEEINLESHQIEYEITYPTISLTM